MLCRCDTGDFIGIPVMLCRCDTGDFIGIPVTLVKVSVEQFFFFEWFGSFRWCWRHVKITERSWRVATVASAAEIREEFERANATKRCKIGNMVTAVPPSGKTEEEYPWRARLARWKSLLCPADLHDFWKRKHCCIYGPLLAARLAEARDLSYITVMGWLQFRLSFCLLYCTVMCFRGSQSCRTTAQDNFPNLACSAARAEFCHLS